MPYHGTPFFKICYEIRKVVNINSDVVYLECDYLVHTWNNSINILNNWISYHDEPMQIQLNWIAYDDEPMQIQLKLFLTDGIVLVLIIEWQFVFHILILVDHHNIFSIKCRDILTIVLCYWVLFPLFYHVLFAFLCFSSWLWIPPLLPFSYCT